MCAFCSHACMWHTHNRSLYKESFSSTDTCFLPSVQWIPFLRSSLGFHIKFLDRPPSPQHQGFAWLPAPLPQPPQEAERTVMPPWLPWGPLKSCDEARERARASVLQVSTLQFNCFLPNAGCKVFGFFYRHRTEKKKISVKILLTPVGQGLHFWYSLLICPPILCSLHPYHYNSTPIKTVMLYLFICKSSPFFWEC